MSGCGCGIPLDDSESRRCGVQRMERRAGTCYCGCVLLNYCRTVGEFGLLLLVDIEC